jgi:hypothetical protein
MKEAFTRFEMRGTQYILRVNNLAAAHTCGNMTNMPVPEIHVAADLTIGICGKIQAGENLAADIALPMGLVRPKGYVLATNE